MADAYLIFHFYILIDPLAAPTTGDKRKADDTSHAGDSDRADRQRTVVRVAMASGNVPLKRTWEMSELGSREGLLTKFRVRPPCCYSMSILIILILKALIRYYTVTKLDHLVNWEDQLPRSKDNAKLMVSST